MRLILVLSALILTLVGCDKKGGGGGGGNRYGYNNCYGNYGGRYGVGNYQWRGQDCYDTRLKRFVDPMYCENAGQNYPRTGNYNYNYRYGNQYCNDYGYGRGPYGRGPYDYGYGNGPYDWGYSMPYAMSMPNCMIYSTGNVVYYPAFNMYTNQWWCVEYAVVHAGGYWGGFHFQVRF